MFEKTLLESKGTHEGRNKWLTIPVSLGIHTFIIAGLIFFSYWFITDAIQFPPIPMVIVVAALPAPPPPPPPPGPPDHPEVPKPQPEKPPEVVQPSAVPEKIPPPEEVLERGKGVGDGSADGVPGGMKDGVPGGVLEGIPGGILGSPGGDGFGDILGDSWLDKDRPIEFNPKMNAPVQLKRVEPLYPPVMIKARIQGMVIIKAVIGITGDVEDAEIWRGVHSILDQAALEAVMQWKYTPALLDGRPVKIYFTVTVTFSLE